MVDSDLVDYIKTYRKEFSMAKLKEGLLDQGVDSDDIDEAIDFVKKSDEEKIAEFLEESNSIEEELDLEGGSYKEKASEIIDTLSGSLGVKEKDKGVFIDSIKYGALSFLFLRIVLSIFEYLAGSYAYAGVVKEQAVTGALALRERVLPDMFMPNTGIIFLFKSFAISIVLGGILGFIFMRFLVNLWPLKNWHGLDKRVFIFYAVFTIFFGILINNFFMIFNSAYFIGSLIVIVGMIVSSYIAGLYFSNTMEARHEKRIREIIH